MSFRFKAIVLSRAKRLLATKALEKFGAYHIVIQPINTEKNYTLATTANKYFFRVHNESNKNDIRKAIQIIYGFIPKSVNTVSMPDKNKVSRTTRKAYKKAVVTLAEGDKIDFI